MKTSPLSESLDPEAWRMDELPGLVGSHDAAGLTFALVAARFNSGYTRKLVRAVIETLQQQGASADDIRLYWVPGTFEIPAVLNELGERGFSALLALGVVIEGETPHAEYIGRAVTQALCELSPRYRVPVIDGVVTARTPEQAAARCADDDKNRGRYAALAAIETATLFQRIRAS